MPDTPETLEQELTQAVNYALGPKADPPAPPAVLGPKLAAALVAFQAEMEPIPRSRTVSVQTKTGGRYTFVYAPHNVIAMAMRPVLSKHGLGLIQPLVGHAVRTIIFHESGEQYAADFPLGLRGSESPQEVGSKVTYVRRYALSILGLVTEEDDDANHATGSPITKQADKEQTKTTPKATGSPETPAAAKSGSDLTPAQKQLYAAFKKAEKAGTVTAEQFKARLTDYGTKLGGLTDEQVPELVAWLDAEGIPL